MDSNEEPNKSLTDEAQAPFSPHLAVLSDASHDANVPKPGDQENKHLRRTTESEKQSSASPTADLSSLAAQLSEDRYAGAFKTVKSARSSRSDTMFDETPPHFDVAVDEEDQGFDPALADMSRPGSTTTAESDVFDYVEENGRTYHRYSDGKYILPNDAEELDRLDLQNHLWGLTLNDRLYLAPIESKDFQNVLDMGCGTGIWTINFADKFPHARVIGTDLSPVQPKWVPPNCVFEITDMEHEWTFSSPLDYIHGRMLFTCFTMESAKAIFTSAFHALKPGGYLELQDCIFPQKCIDDSSLGTSLSLWNSLCIEASVKLGRPWNTVQHWSAWLREIGFEDVHEEVFMWPINTWPRDKGLKELGMWFREDVLSVLPATGRLLTKGLDWTSEEVEVLLAGVKEDVKSRQVHMFEEVRVMYGRKPLEA